MNAMFDNMHSVKAKQSKTKQKLQLEKKSMKRNM
jgi:hypothetical protein